MTNEINNEEVLNNSSSTLVYVGTVKIEEIRGNKVIKTYTSHNEGKASLFNFIAQCLSGKLEDRLRPKYLRAYNKNGTTYTQITNTQISFRSVRAVGDKTIYKFLIPANTLNAATELNHFRLFSQDNVNIVDNIDSCCASIDYVAKTNSDKLLPDGKTNFLVTWTLQVTNNTNGGN